MTDHVVVIGGGPGGYEAALVAAQLGAEVTVVDTDGIGGSAVLTDCVPSKTLIATAELMTDVAGANELGVMIRSERRRPRRPGPGQPAGQGAGRRPVRRHRRGGSRRRASGSSRAAAAWTAPTGSWSSPGRREEILEADAVLVATGAAPRTLPTAQPDGERILTWEQVYDLDEVPTELIVVGSGVTGAEFACGYLALGIPVTLVSSRDRVLPGEDADAAAVLEEVLDPPRDDRAVALADGVGDPLRRRRDRDAHRRPHRRGLALHPGPRLGARTPPTSASRRPACVLKDGGFVNVDRVSRTSARGVYAAGDCTGVLMLASVAAMQGRIAMWHFLGDAVTPARPQEGLLQRLHRPRDRHRRLVAAGRSTPARSRPRRSPCRSPATPAPRCRASTTAS